MNNDISWGQQGWICHKCGSVWAPHVSGCHNCNRGASSTSTIPSLYDEYKFSQSSTSANDAYKNITVTALNYDQEQIAEILDNLKN